MIAIAIQASLLTACFTTETRDKPGPGKVPAVEPNVLERGQFVWVSLSGAPAPCGDSAWLARENVRIMGEEVERVTDSACKVKFEIPVDAATGEWDMHVNLENGLSLISLPKGIEVVLPRSRVRRISPAKVGQLGPFTLSILGENTRFNDDAPLSLWLQADGDTLKANQLTVRRSDSLEATFDMTQDMFNAGKWDLYLRSNTRLMLQTEALEVDRRMPEILGITPDSTEQLLLAKLVVTGANTRFRQGTFTVLLKKGAETITTHRSEPSSDTSLEVQFNIPQDAGIGLWDLELEQPWYRVQKQGALSIRPVGPPRLLSLSPDSAEKGTSIDVAITGSRVFFTQGSQTAIRLTLKNGTDSIHSEFRNYPELDFQPDFIPRMKIDIPAGAASGLWDVHLGYHLRAGGPLPLGVQSSNIDRWVELLPLLQGFRIR